MKPFWGSTFFRFFTSLIIIISLDQAFKALALEAKLSSLIFNSGWVGGALSDSVVTVRVGILVGYYCGLWVFLLSFLHEILNLNRFTQFAILLFFGGISGNMLDRMRLGYVIDFIPFNVGSYHAAFNSADLFLGLGILLICISIAKYLRTQGKERRTGIFVNYRLQLRLFIQISLVFFGFILAVTGLSLLLFYSEGNQNPHLLVSFLLIVLAYGILFEAILLSVLLAVTQRWLGPVYSFIEFMKKENSHAPFRVRKGDEFKDLEWIARKRS